MHEFIRGVTVRRKPLIECPGWLECSETGVGSLCWWWVYTKLTSSTYNARSVTIKPCRVLSFLITCICMLKNLTPCKLWFLTSCKVSNDVYIPKKPQQEQEKWLFPHPNESIYAYRDGKNYDRVNSKFPSPSLLAVQTRKGLLIPFLISARRPFGFCIFLCFQARTFA